MPTAAFNSASKKLSEVAPPYSIEDLPNDQMSVVQVNKEDGFPLTKIAAGETVDVALQRLKHFGTGALEDKTGLALLGTQLITAEGEPYVFKPLQQPHPVFNSASKKLSEVAPPYSIEDLPKDQNDPVWQRIEEKYNLELDELGALKNHVRDQRQHMQSDQKAKKKFDLEHLMKIKPTDSTESTSTKWNDYGYQMEFRGRTRFLEQVEEYLNHLSPPTPNNSPETDTQNISGEVVHTSSSAAAAAAVGEEPIEVLDPPTLTRMETPKTDFPGNGGIKRATALVYSSVSGSGKTVAMLRLKKHLKGKEVKGGLVAVAYLGFNSGLPLTEEEKDYLNGTESHGRAVLARRLVAATIISLNNAEQITTMPNAKKVFDGYEIPPGADSFTLLFEYMKQHMNNQSLYIVAGVDEVQMLNKVHRIASQPDIGLGRFFLRILREWQVNLADYNIRILPLGTGIALDWECDESTGKNRNLTGDDTTLISKEDFRSLTKQVVDGLGDEEFNNRFSMNTAKGTAINLISAVYWPRVRLLQWWRDGHFQDLSEAGDDKNSQCWTEWLCKWMFDEGFVITQSRDLVPGKGDEEGRINALFELTADRKKVSVIPDGFNAKSLLQSLHMQLPLWQLYGPLINEFGNMMPDTFMPKDEYKFEDMGFAVVGIAIHSGLHALRTNRQFSLNSNFNPTQKMRLGLARWFREKGAITVVQASMDVLEPEVCGVESTGNVGLYYPFQGHDQSNFESRFVSILLNAIDNQRPIYVRCGKNTCCDCLYFYVNADKQLVGVIAKLTNSPEGSGESISTVDQIGLFNAAANVQTALAHMNVTLHSARLLFVTNKSKLANATIQKQESLEIARDNARKYWPGIETELLNKGSFDFGPFSEVLFARRQKENEERPKKIQKTTVEKKTQKSM